MGKRVEWWTGKHVFRYQIQRCDVRPCRLLAWKHTCGNVLLFDENGSYMDERTPTEFAQNYKRLSPRP